MLNMPIYYFIIISIALAISCFFSIAFAFGYTHKLNRIEMTNAETDEFEMTIFKQNNTTKSLKNAINAFKITALLSSVLSLIAMMVFMYYTTEARKYGAFDEFYKTESINIITNNIEHGFVDQSESLPENLQGCIIIYFKYGCSDCGRIHDDLLEYVETNNVQNIYFVSTRSEKGKQLLETYPVMSVPTGVYVLHEPIQGVNQITEVLYDINAPDDAEDIFLPENLENLINCQSLNE